MVSNQGRNLGTTFFMLKHCNEVIQILDTDNKNYSK